ncbi:hypothetical protein D2E25_0170 [Bifidobacterium goeldii]|uniref:Uncharacterized protein n=1 Tax=Bifidobacterium goeldii TaxID=2306975 RepID=A0A430FLU7_9BIFI|nr:hypothetical protein [Bifidobacterium goeldii]RSX53864.1 hypothetical protein D2E25_0170 [Bifidobacterium goeldii]
MTKLIKRLIAAACSILCLLSIMIQPAYASSDENIGLTTDPSYLIEGKKTRGQDLPGPVWNISSKGAYSFKGSNIYQFIYTNYLFTGKKNYTIWIRNTGSSPIDIYTTKRRLLVEDTNIDKHTVNPGVGLQYTVSTGSSDKIYLCFYNAAWYYNKSSSISFNGDIS